MFPNNEAWDALAASLNEMSELMVKVGKAEIFAWVCIVWSACMAVYFATLILNGDKSSQVEKLVLKQSITSFSSVKPISKQVKPINSGKQGQKDTKGTFRDPEIDRILEEFRR